MSAILHVPIAEQPYVLCLPISAQFVTLEKAENTIWLTQWEPAHRFNHTWEGWKMREKQHASVRCSGVSSYSIASEVIPVLNQFFLAEQESLQDLFPEDVSCTFTDEAQFSSRNIQPPENFFVNYISCRSLIRPEQVLCSSNLVSFINWLFCVHGTRRLRLWKKSAQ